MPEGRRSGRPHVAREVRRYVAAVPCCSPVDWTIRAGERWVVIGANGAGKSTLLRPLAGALPPTTGEVSAAGRAAGRRRPRRAAAADRLGERGARRPDSPPTSWFSTSCSPRRTRPCAAAEHYDEQRRTPGPACSARSAAALLVDRRFGTLSARASASGCSWRGRVMTDPELLLLDEPAAGLDLGGREALLRLLGRLADDPRAPVQVLVSHHVEEIPDGIHPRAAAARRRVVAAGPIESTLTRRRCRGLRTAAAGAGHRGRWTAPRHAMPGLRRR